MLTKYEDSNCGGNRTHAILAREAELQSADHRDGDWILLPDKLVNMF